MNDLKKIRIMRLYDLYLWGIFELYTEIEYDSKLEITIIY